MNTPTTPTPPEGLTDEELFKLAADALGYVSIRHSDEDLHGAYEATGAELLAAMRAAIAADRAQRAQIERTVDPIRLVEAGIEFGYMAGHNDTVEGCYGDPTSIAKDFAAETLSDVRAQHVEEGEDRRWTEGICGNGAAILFDGAMVPIEEVVRALNSADHAARPTPAPVADLAQVLASAGVFKGSHGLRGLLDADAFWEQQPYGTRIYYGDGIADYLHRDVLRCAVTLLEQFSLGGWIVPTVEQVTPTPEEIESTFRAWWKASYPSAPVNNASVAYHVAFALHLLRGVQ